MFNCPFHPFSGPVSAMNNCCIIVSDFHCISYFTFINYALPYSLYSGKTTCQTDIGKSKAWCIFRNLTIQFFFSITSANASPIQSRSMGTSPAPSNQEEEAHPPITESHLSEDVHCQQIKGQYGTHQRSQSLSGSYQVCAFLVIKLQK